MNAASISRDDIMEENAGDSDSDAHSDGAPEYYQPISATEDADDDEDSNEGNAEYHSFGRHMLSNGPDHRAENGMRSLNLSDEETQSEEEEEEEQRMRAESAIATAFREDESRRNAPLTTENASRVREAMRGVSFAGFAPDWASRVPEEQWIHQLRRLRHSPHSAA